MKYGISGQTKIVRSNDGGRIGKCRFFGVSNTHVTFASAESLKFGFYILQKRPVEKSYFQIAKQRVEVNPLASLVADQGPLYAKAVDIFQASIKQKFQTLQKIRSKQNCRNKFICKLVLQKNACSRFVLFVHSKLDHVARSRKSEHFRKDELIYLSRNLNSALSPTAGKPKLRHIREDLLVNNRTHLFLVVFYLPRKYDIMFEKVAD